MSTKGISRYVLLTLFSSKSFSRYYSTLLVNSRKFVGKFFPANECKQTCRCPAIRNYEMRNSIGRATPSDSTVSQPLYNVIGYNTVLDITQISAGPQMVIRDLFSYTTTCVFFTLNSTDWIANPPTIVL